MVFSQSIHGEMDLTASLNALTESSDRVNRGDLAEAEALPTAQAMTLNTILVEQLKVLVVDARRVNAAIEDEYLAGVTPHGFSRWSKETKELGAVPSVAAFLASREFGAFIEKLEAASK